MLDDDDGYSRMWKVQSRRPLRKRCARTKGVGGEENGILKMNLSAGTRNEKARAIALLSLSLSSWKSLLGS